MEKIKKNNQVEISIVIPIYNTEKYLDILLDSIKNQTFKAFEVLMMNDGSKDNSEKICLKYQQEDERFKYIYHTNIGVSAIRNYALDFVNGKYLIFIDADDYIEKNMIWELYKNIIDSKADMVVCGYYMEIYKENSIRQKTDISINHHMEISIADGYSDAMAMIWEKSLMYNVWNRLLKTDQIKDNNLKFSEDMKMGEDLDFNIKYLMYCKHICVIPDKLYHYIREREDSATSNKYIPNWYEIRQEENIRLNEYFNMLGYKNDRAKEFLKMRYIERVIGCIENELKRKNNKSQYEKYKDIKKMVDDEKLQSAIREVDINSRLLNVIAWNIKRKNYIGVFFIGKFTSVIRERFPVIFFKLKVNRNKGKIKNENLD